MNRFADKLQTLGVTWPGHVGAANTSAGDPTTIPTSSSDFLATMKGEFSQDANALGLQVVGEPQIVPVDDRVQGVSITAAAPPGDLSAIDSQPFFMQHASFFPLDNTNSGMTPIATTDLVFERNGNQITSTFVTHLYRRADSLTGVPTGVGAFVIRQETIITLADLEAVIHNNVSDSAANVSAALTDSITKTSESITLSDGMGAEVSYDPQLLTLDDALLQLGGNCPSCFIGCLTDDSISIGLPALICAIAGAIRCAPVCACLPCCALCFAVQPECINAALSIGVSLASCAGDCWSVPDSGEIEDCNGTCAPIARIGDGVCDDGRATFNFACDAFACDGGDCNCCPPGAIADCNGACGPESWVGDGICDDASSTWNFDCDALGNDGGDCATGACCIAGGDCSVVTGYDCHTFYIGAYQGDGTSCAGAGCGTRCAPICDWCWTDTPVQNTCPNEWNGTGDGCDCGCQFSDPDCQAPCSEADCTSWEAGSCSGGSCASDERVFTRSCSVGCGFSEQRCECDDSCGCGDVGECDPPPNYEFCVEASFGNCDVSMAINWYSNVNSIRWGHIVDSSDPYVIGEYQFGWTDVDAKQIYYACDGNTDCEYGGCNCEQIADTGTRVTVTAPGMAHYDGILAYDDTPEYWCARHVDAFYPNYNNDVDRIYVLRCYDDNDCSANQRCETSGDWTTWACVERLAEGTPCSDANECLSGFCDNDGVGLADDGWCFTPASTYFDGQEPSYCEYSTGLGSSDCDERLVGESFNTCIGLSYREEQCSSTCNPSDTTDVFECTDAGCSCAEPLCDGLPAGAPIPTCSGGLPYFADSCSATADGIDRGDNICRSSAFAAGCTGAPECNGLLAGTGNCALNCLPGCGNGVCDLGESCTNCPEDCGYPASCGNGACQPECGENPDNCAVDGCGIPRTDFRTLPRQTNTVAEGADDVFGLDIYGNYRWILWGAAGSVLLSESLGGYTWTQQSDAPVSNYDTDRDVTVFQGRPALGYVTSPTITLRWAQFRPSGWLIYPPLPANHASQNTPVSLAWDGGGIMFFGYPTSSVGTPVLYSASPGDWRPGASLPYYAKYLRIETLHHLQHRPALAAYDSDARAIKLAVNTPSFPLIGGWDISTVDQANVVSGDPYVPGDKGVSLAVHSGTGTIGITYTRHFSDSVTPGRQWYEYVYAWNDGSGWQTSAFDVTEKYLSASDPRFGTSLAYLPNGTPVVAYDLAELSENFATAGVRLAWRDQGSWYSMTIDSGFRWYRAHPNIAIVPSSGLPGLAWRRPVPGGGTEVRYVEFLVGSDCNGNTILDACDINCGLPGGSCDRPGCGASPDCNMNEIPDECEIPVGSPGGLCTEACDPDCNHGGIPDECELAGNDCDGDSVPDECQPDCDADGTPNVCELPPFGSSEDCNGDGVPDECQSGACCNETNGVCIDGAAPCDCVGDQRAWYEDLPCDDPGVACVGCPQDLNGDGDVGPTDLASLLDHWGPCPDAPDDCSWDLNGDVDVGPADLANLLDTWGPCP